MSTYHTSVLLQRSVEALNINRDGVYVDATLGGAGHTREILSHLSSKGRLIVFDRDSDALANAPKDDRLILVHNNFRFVHNFVRYSGFDKVDGILADLGVSSHQFDTSERGFSFRFDAPLDMRMNKLSSKTARDIINNYDKEQLKNILKTYGEVEYSGKIAGLICSSREKKSIETTQDLRQAIEKILPRNAEHKFLAKIYQALRIEVNGEMRSLENFLVGALASLKQGGRLSLITYHSLEDRMVKNFIRYGSIYGEQQSDIYGRLPSPLKAVNKKPELPTESEIASNTRARSAKLRIAEKI